MYFEWFSGLDVIKILRAPPIDPQIGKKNLKNAFLLKKRLWKHLNIYSNISNWAYGSQIIYF